MKERGKRRGEEGEGGQGENVYKGEKSEGVEEGKEKNEGKGTA